MLTWTCVYELGLVTDCLGWVETSRPQDLYQPWKHSKPVVFSASWEQDLTYTMTGSFYLQVYTLRREAHSRHSTHMCLVSGVVTSTNREPISLGCRNECIPERGPERGGESLEFPKGCPMGKSPNLPLNSTTRLSRLRDIRLSLVSVSSASFPLHT